MAYKEHCHSLISIFRELSIRENSFLFVITDNSFLFF